MDDPNLKSAYINPKPPSEQSFFERYTWAKTLAIGLVISQIGIAIALVGYFLWYQAKKADEAKTKSQNTVIQTSPTQLPSPPPQASTSGILLSVVVLKDVKIPFVRDRSIYWYTNGKEELVVEAKQKNTQSQRFDNAYPFLSPDGKFLAFISFNGEKYDINGFPPYEGTLKILNTQTKEIQTTAYKTDYFQWNKDNQLVFSVTKSGSTKSVVFDPTSSKEVVSLTTQNTLPLGYTSIFTAQKYITIQKNTYNLINGDQNKSLYQSSKNVSFLGWSPDGVYAIFLEPTTQSQINPQYVQQYVAIDTTDSNLKKTVIAPLTSGGAGGEAGRGLKWYFNKGFVPYCTEELYFVSGEQPMPLTRTGGGGCNNEDGFIATSPGGDYALVKFADRFELHSRDGNRKKVNEAFPMTKTRLTPKEMIWINSDYLAIYQSTSSTAVDVTNHTPYIYLYSRQSNKIVPIIANGYLTEIASGIP